MSETWTTPNLELNENPHIFLSEFDFYELCRSTFEKSELVRIKKLLPLREMSEDFGLVSKSLKPKLTNILYIFFGIHTANAVQLEKRIEQQALLEAA